MSLPSRPWMEIEGDPIRVETIDTNKISLPSFDERLKEALLAVADLAYKLEPGQMLSVTRQLRTLDQAIFKVQIYAREEESKGDA